MKLLIFEVTDLGSSHRFIIKLLDAFGGTMLPNAQWCPRGSRLAREVMPSAKREG